MTEIGQDYYRHCLAMLVEADARAGSDRTHALRAAGHRAHQLPAGAALLPGRRRCSRASWSRTRAWSVHLESTNRRVDVIGEGFDIAMRVRFPPLEDSDLVMKVLADSTQCLVASPASAEENAASAGARRSRRACPASTPARPHREHAWCLDGPDGATALVPHKPRLVTDDMVALRLAALAGVGVVQLPPMMVRSDLIDGTLVDVMPHGRRARASCTPYSPPAAACCPRCAASSTSSPPSSPPSAERKQSISNARPALAPSEPPRRSVAGPPRSRRRVT